MAFLLFQWGKDFGFFAALAIDVQALGTFVDSGQDDLACSGRTTLDTSHAPDATILPSLRHAARHFNALHGAAGGAGAALAAGFRVGRRCCGGGHYGRLVGPVSGNLFEIQEPVVFQQFLDLNSELLGQFNVSPTRSPVGNRKLFGRKRVLTHKGGGSDHLEPLCGAKVAKLRQRILVCAIPIYHDGHGGGPLSFQRPKPLHRSLRKPSAINRHSNHRHIRRGEDEWFGSLPGQGCFGCRFSAHSAADCAGYRAAGSRWGKENTMYASWFHRIYPFISRPSSDQIDFSTSTAGPLP